MKTTVRDAVIVLGLAHVELAHRRNKTGRAGGSVENDRELLRDVSMLARWGRDHVKHSLPDFV